MDERRLRLYRLKHIDNRRQGFVIDLNELQGIFGRTLVLRRNRYHRITDVADFIDSKNRLIAKCRTIIWVDARHLCDLRAGQHCRHAVEPFGSGFFDSNDSRVRIKAAQDRDVEHSRHLYITHVQCSPSYFGVGILSVN
jgi:hypothetical protein